jgi:hypothetical protein
MRSFIKSCGQLFIILGGSVSFLGVLFGLLTNMTEGVPGMGLLIAFSTCIGGASLALSGGVAYMLAAIDERLEAVSLAVAPAAATTSAPWVKPSAPVELNLMPLPAIKSVADAGPYLHPSGHQIWHAGGMISSKMHGTDYGLK